MSGAGWAFTEPALPPPAWTPGRVGRPAEYGRRDITGGIRYLVKEKSGATGDMRAELRRQCGIAAGRAPEPTAAIIGSHLVKAAGTAGNPSRGYDAGKKISGRKRHIAVDTTGLLLTVLITAAGVQDRDGAEPLLWNLRTAFPPVKLTWAGGGYAGKLVTWAKNELKPKLAPEIVRRPGGLHTFQVLPRRWVAGRTLA